MEMNFLNKRNAEKLKAKLTDYRRKNLSAYFRSENSSESKI